MAVADGSVLVRRKTRAEPVEQLVLADVEVARRTRRTGPGAVVAVATSVPGAPIDPVRVHAPAAQPALHQPG